MEQSIKQLSEQFLSKHYAFFYPDLVLVAGEGPYVLDDSGKQYIDGTSGESFFNLGRKHPVIVDVKS